MTGTERPARDYAAGRVDQELADLLRAAGAGAGGRRPDNRRCLVCAFCHGRHAPDCDEPRLRERLARMGVEWD